MMQSASLAWMRQGLCEGVTDEVSLSSHSLTHTKVTVDVHSKRIEWLELRGFGRLSGGLAYSGGNPPSTIIDAELRSIRR